MILLYTENNSTFQVDVDDFGVDWTAPAPDYDSDEGVHVPDTLITSVRLMHNIDPLAPCDDYGISFYLQALNLR